MSGWSRSDGVGAESERSTTRATRGGQTTSELQRLRPFTPSPLSTIDAAPHHRTAHPPPSGQHGSGCRRYIRVVGSVTVVEHTIHTAAVVVVHLPLFPHIPHSPAFSLCTLPFPHSSLCISLHAAIHPSCL